MRKNYLKFLLVFLCTLSAPSLKAQVVGDLDITWSPSMSHDSTQCASMGGVMFLITVHNSFLGDSIKIVDIGTSLLLHEEANTTGDSVWNIFYGLPMYVGYVTDDQITGGAAHFFGPDVKIVSGPDTAGPYHNSFSYFVTNPCIYGNVSGRTYIDNNGNCIYDLGDVALNAMLVTSTANLFGTGPSTIQKITTTDPSGNYNLTVRSSWMTNYNVTLPSEYYFIFPPTTCFTGPYVYTTLPHTGVDFPLLCTGSVDIECWAGSPGYAQPSRPFYMHPTVANIGCDSISGQLTLVKDHRVIYNAGLSTIPADWVSGDTLVWNYTKLTNLTGGAYWNCLQSHIHLTPDLTATIGDTLCFRIYADIPGTDINPLNNDYSVCLPVVAAYDPNAKEASPKGTGPTGLIPRTTDELTYTIHFQNTGTAAASYVGIIDTLDSHLDPTSLRVLSTSHHMIPEWLAPGVVKFNYDGINLPDSTSNEPASHGYVRFSIKLHSGLPSGTQIRNKGYIYFDGNPPVITSTATNTLEATTQINTLATNEIKVYPNPASDQITVENLQNGRVEILNITGSVLISQQITSNKATIAVNEFPTGVYILKTISNGNTTTRKFIKQ